MFGQFGQIASLLQNLPKMREEMEKFQAQLAQISAEGDAGGGMVKAKVNGHLEVVKITLSDEAVRLNDKEMLEDLIAAAVTQAVKKAKVQVGEETARIAG